VRKVTLLLLLVMAIFVSAQSEIVPPTSSFQGYLTDSTGSPLNGSFDIVARVFDDSTGGTMLWEKTLSMVPVQDGFFNLELQWDFGNLLGEMLKNLSLSSLQDPLLAYLEFEIEGQLVYPRTLINSSPSSMAAGKLVGDIFTDPGVIKIYPYAPDPAIDCTMAPINMMANPSLATLRLRPPDLDVDCTYYPIEFTVSTDKVIGLFQPPEPVLPTDSLASSIALTVDSASAKLELSGQLPGGSKKHFRGAAYMWVRPNLTQLNLSEENTVSDSSSVKINTIAGGENAINIVDSRPMLGNKTVLNMGTDFDGTGESGLRMNDSKPAGAANNSSCTNVLVDARQGTLMQMIHTNVGTNLTNRLKTFTDPVRSGISVSSSSGGAGGCKWPGDCCSGIKKSTARTAANAEVNIFADTGSARIEVIGDAAAGGPPIVLINDVDGGRIGINTYTPTEQLHVVGNICATGTIGACSDKRYKKDIKTIDDALEIIEQLRGVNFSWRTDDFPENQFSEKEQVGFIAQEIEKVLPEVISKGSNGYYSVDYAKLTPVLVEAVKSQQKTIDEIKTQNDKLAEELSELKQMVQALASNSTKKRAEYGLSDSQSK
jgi:hypothetical protein